MDLLTWQAPDVDDHTARHQRGAILLPYRVHDADAGDLVAAWVCCDPACGGVEGGPHVLDINHGCCDLPRLGTQRAPVRGRHRVGLGTVHFTGRHHGPLTQHWLPDASPGGEQR